MYARGTRIFCENRTRLCETQRAVEVIHAERVSSVRERFSVNGLDRKWLNNEPFSGRIFGCASSPDTKENNGTGAFACIQSHASQKAPKRCNVDAHGRARMYRYVHVRVAMYREMYVYMNTCRASAGER